MGILECPGVFGLALPDGWVARGSRDREYSIEHPGIDGAITISVLAKPEGATSESTARTFARKLGVADADTLDVLTPPQRGQKRSFLRMTALEHDWFVGCLFFKRDFVLATFNTGIDDDDAFHTGEMLVASIYPLRRRLRRRSS